MTPLPGPASCVPPRGQTGYAPEEKQASSTTLPVKNWCDGSTPVSIIAMTVPVPS